MNPETLAELLQLNAIETLATDLMSSECDEQCDAEYQRLMPDKRDNGQTIRFFRRYPGGAELLTEMTA